jgi:hypothetical protein
MPCITFKLPKFFTVLFYLRSSTEYVMMDNTHLRENLEESTSACVSLRSQDVFTITHLVAQRDVKSFTFRSRIEVDTKPCGNLKNLLIFLHFCFFLPLFCSHEFVGVRNVDGNFFVLLVDACEGL